MTKFDDHYECIVIGGGPAGATVATLLAQHRHKPLLLERATFPRHHIGESLMPETYWTFKRLGMLEKLGVSDYPRKQSVGVVVFGEQNGANYGLAGNRVVAFRISIAHMLAKRGGSHVIGGYRGWCPSLD